MTGICWRRPISATFCDTARVAAPSVCFAAARILAGRGPNSSSLFPPLAAVVAVAPEGRGTGVSVKPMLDE